MSDIWFTSDTHFGHANIIRHCARPFATVNEMDDALEANWNACVKARDTVYHLGDFAFLKPGLIANQLRRLGGKKHIVLGNHDKAIRKARAEFTGPGLFESINDCLELDMRGMQISLFHFAQRVWNGSHFKAIHLYGHSHGNLPPLGRSVDVGVDCKEITPEYRPVNLDEIAEFMKGR